MNIKQETPSTSAIAERKRPLSVALIAWLFIVAGTVGIVYHATEFRVLDSDLLWALFVRLLAIVGGVFALRGANWARWLLLVWIAYHVVLSVFHPLPELAAHTVLCAVVAYVLFRPQSSVYFRGAK